MMSTRDFTRGSITWYQHVTAVLGKPGRPRQAGPSSAPGASEPPDASARAAETNEPPPAPGLEDEPAYSQARPALQAHRVRCFAM